MHYICSGGWVARFGLCVYALVRCGLFVDCVWVFLWFVVTIWCFAFCWVLFDCTLRCWVLVGLVVGGCVCL